MIFKPGKHPLEMDLKMFRRNLISFKKIFMSLNVKIERNPLGLPLRFLMVLMSNLWTPSRVYKENFYCQVRKYHFSRNQNLLNACNSS